MLSNLEIQWNPVNTDTKGTGQSVRIKRALRENVRTMKGLYMYVNTGRKTGCSKSNMSHFFVTVV